MVWDFCQWFRQLGCQHFSYFLYWRIWHLESITFLIQIFLVVLVGIILLIFKGNGSHFIKLNFHIIISFSSICFIVLFIFIFSLINFKKTNAKCSLIFSCFSLVLVLMQLPIFPWKLFSVFTIVQDPARFSTLFGLFSALSLVLILPILLDKISGKTSYYLTISLLVIF